MKGSSHGRSNIAIYVEVRYERSPGYFVCIRSFESCTLGFLTISTYLSEIFIMFWSTLTASVLFTQSAFAQNMLRFACSQLTVERADPLVNPGQRPSPHTHQIIGANSFNLTVIPLNLSPYLSMQILTVTDGARRLRSTY
jgi:hypothetical protein